MARSENEKGIRVKVRLCDEEGTPLDVPGLIAIPSDRLACFERIAILSRELVAALEAAQENPTSGVYYSRLRALKSELLALTALWDGPKSA